MNKIFSLLLAMLFPLGALAFTNDCGNLDDPPCECEDEEDCEGYPVNPQMASVFRVVTDLETFGAAPISFTRSYNSRTTNFNPPYWELGAEQTWQHNWNYEVRDLTSTTFGHKDVKVRYPGGREDNFKATDSTGLIRAPSAKNGDRLYKWTGSTVGHTLVTPGGREYDFKRTTSPKYRLETMRNGQGLTWTLTYDSTNHLQRVENDFGRWIEVDRETGSNGVVRISGVRTSDGRQATYSYADWLNGTDTNSVLTTVSYPDGSQAQYTYVGAETNDVGRAVLASAVDPRFSPSAGAQMKWSYNYNAIFDFGNGPYLVTGTVLEERNLVTDELVVSLPLGSGEEPQVVLGDGTEVGRRYQNGHLVEKRDGEGHPTFYTRTDGGWGYLASTMDAQSNVTSFVRDYAGRMTQRIDPLGHTNSFAYNAAGFVLTNTDVLGHSTIYTRNASNLVTRVDYSDSSFETFAHNQYGQVLTNQLRNGGTVINSYNATGDLQYSTDPLGNTSTITWNNAGLMASATDARGNTTSYTYDWRGQMLVTTNADNTVIRFQYNSFGNRTNQVDELGHATVSTYDAYNRLQTVTDPLGRTTSYEYGRSPSGGGGCGSCGSVNLISRITDPAGKVTEYAYDRSDRRTNETTAAGSTTWTYDSVGRQKTQTDANGHTYTWVYNALNRVIAETNALGQATTYTYDAVGNRTNRVDGAGVVTFWTYDNINRLKSENSGTLTYEYGYDLGGRRTNMNSKINGVVTESTSYTYDARELLLTKTDPTGFTLTYGYDSVGNRTNLSVGSVLSQSYTYDTRNRVKTITGNGKTTTFGYDASSRRVAASWPNGSMATNIYDGADQLVSLLHKTSGGSNISSFVYGYDLSGNRTNMTTLEGINSYSYNSDNWLTVADYPDGKSQRFFYDSVGNRTNLAEIAGATTNITAYTYGGANRLVSSISGTLTNTYTHDGAGRLTNQTVGVQSRNYGYSFRSQMTSLVDTNGFTFTYDFDGDANRTKQSGSGCLTSRYVYDGLDAVLELNASNQVVNAYVNGLRIDQKLERIAFVNGIEHARHVYHTDALGSVVALTDNGQQTAKSYSYEAFGKIRSENGQFVINRYTYTTREALGDSIGLYYYRWRVMDPNLARFDNEDPLGFVDGANLYLYVMNDPIDRKDPLGLAGYGNYCGSGGSGSAIDPLDAACQKHDACYSSCQCSGVGGYVKGFLPGCAQKCDCQLCLDAASAPCGSSECYAAKLLVMQLFCPKCSGIIIFI